MKLRAKLADKTRECTQLHQRLDAAATAIAALQPLDALSDGELGARPERRKSDLRPAALAPSPVVRHVLGERLLHYSRCALIEK